MVRLEGLRHYKPEPDPKVREKTLERLAQWRAADEALKRHCEERGIEVPILVC